MQFRIWSVLILFLFFLLQVGRIAYRNFGLVPVFVILGGVGIVFALQMIKLHRAKKRLTTGGSEAEAALLRGDYTEAIRLTESAIGSARDLSCSDADVLALTLVIRSEAQLKLDKKEEALQSAAQAFSCSCNVRMAETQVAVFDQLGSVLMETGHDRRAIPVLETVVSLGEQLEKKPLNTAGRLERVGLAYSRVGLHTNSVAAFGKAISLMTGELGADSAQLSNPYVNLGNAYKRSEKKEDAERCYRESLRIQEVSGTQTPENRSLVLLNLGAICGETGRLEEAEANYLEVLKLRINIYGRNHWRVGNTYNNLANNLRRKRDFAKAEEYIHQAIEILESHPEYLANAYDSLARILEDEGKEDEALAMTARAREVQQGRSSPDLSEMANLFEREAQLSARIGDEIRAKDCRSRASQIRQALAVAPPADRDLTNLPEALNRLGEHLQESVRRVKALQETI